MPNIGKGEYQYRMDASDVSSGEVAAVVLSDSSSAGSIISRREGVSETSSMANDGELVERLLESTGVPVGAGDS